MTPLRARLSRLPLRVRLVAGFSLAMLVVLIAAGAFVYWRVAYALDRDLDAELSARTKTLAPLVGPEGRMRNRDAAEATGIAWQVLGPTGAVLDHGGGAGDEPMVTQSDLASVGDHARTIEVGRFLPASPDPYRLHVSRVDSQHSLLVGVRRSRRDEALRELLAQLALAGFGALVVTAFVGDRLARAALRPVERYRRRAADIAAGASGLRLEVPTRRDDEVTRLGHTLNDMLAALEQALERERQFVNEASHELRTPITLLSSRIQLARRRPRSQAEHEHILAELEVDLGRLARLAEELLRLGAAARTTEGSGDLVRTVSRVVEQRRVADPAHADELSLSTPADAVSVAMADVAVERIITNLLDNAAAHGGPPYDIAVDAPAAGWARVVVRDGGSGMDPATLATATRRFARSEEARSRAGAGLGLALVEALTTEVHGELRLCHDGHHVSRGATAPVLCDHGPQMTVTVLLPTAA